MTIPFVPLSEAGNLAECGGKAGSLAAVSRLGIPVPTGLVIPNSVFRAFLGVNRLDAKIAEITASLRAGGYEPVIRASAQISELVVSNSVTVDLLAGFESIWAEFAGETLAVRSSAVGEDSAAASFAGQLDTVLNVDSPEALLNAVLQCWASYWSARCISYQHATGIELEGMGVIVQRLVPACISGVLFTAPPAGAASSTKSSNNMLVEYCYGLGEQLVGGKLNPGTVYIDRDTRSYSRIRLPEGAENGHAERLLEPVLPRLRELGLLLEAHFAGPQDIEWAIDHAGSLFVLQSRPITVASERRPVLLSNANINENYPKPVSPFLYSVASTAFYHYFRNLGAALGIRRANLDGAELPLRNILCAPGSRLYYNLTSINQCFHAAPFGGQIARLFNEFVGCALPCALPPSGAGGARLQKVAVHIGSTAQALVVVVRALYAYLTLSFGIRRFETAADAFDLHCSRKPWKSKSISELNTELSRFLSIRFRQWTGASLADAAAMLTTGLLSGALVRWLPDGNAHAAAVGLLQGLRLVSIMPAVKLWEIAGLIRNDRELARLFQQKSAAELRHELNTDDRHWLCRVQIERYVRDWGFRCSGELMLTEPNFEDDLTPLLELLKCYITMPAVSPNAQVQRQAAERRIARQKLFANVRGPRRAKAAVLYLLLAAAERSVALRERARLKQAMLYSRCRRILLAAGELLVKEDQLQSREDIFLFTYHEVDEILGGRYLFSHHLGEIAAFRRRHHEAVSRQQFPDTFTYHDSAKESGNCNSAIPAQSAENNAAQTLRGSGASGGRFQGRAAVLTDLSQADRLAPGDILVTRQTDPGWGTLLFLCKGLVIERGGMLSHGAIIAREFGIPAVIGVPNATAKIEHHQTITVDGHAGLVHLGER